MGCCLMPQAISPSPPWIATRGQGLDPRGPAARLVEDTPYRGDLNRKVAVLDRLRGPSLLEQGLLCDRPTLVLADLRNR